MIIDGLYKYEISGGEPFDISAKLKNTDGIDYITVHMSSDRPEVPQKMSILFSHPAVNIQHTWESDNNFCKSTPVTWMSTSRVVSKACSEAPVVCCYDGAGISRLCFALDDALNVIKMSAGINEYTCDEDCRCIFFDTPTAEFSEYEVTLRVDNTEKPFYKALNDVSKWWEQHEEYTPAPVPLHATLPMYSTWYSYHQDITPSDIEKECKLAKEIGCETVIVDDGWQAVKGTAYANCGDWKPLPDKFPDIASHVKAVHDIGLKYMLWFSVPFLGPKANVLKRFEHKILNGADDCDAHVLDPRYPEVRDYLTNIYVNALRDWDLDGFKLDFVDKFIQPVVEGELDDDGRDRLSVNDAAYTLLNDVTSRLNSEKDGMLFEFRQRYIGPVMRKFGNMMRAADCAYDSVQNRIRTVDIRMLCGATACHSDMLTWNYSCSADEAARQLTNVIFSVPQISVRLAEIPKSHFDMLKFYLGFFKEYREALVLGELIPLYPSCNYSVIFGRKCGRAVAAVYDASVVPFEYFEKDNVLINSGFSQQVTVISDKDEVVFDAQFYSPTGETVRSEKLEIRCGANVINIPICGMVKFKK